MQVSPKQNRICRVFDARKLLFSAARTGWRYKYEKSEFEELAAMMPKRKTAYVLLNNIEMTEDAFLFQEIVHKE